MAIPDPAPRPTRGHGGPLAMSIQRLWANWRFVRSQRDLDAEDRAAWLQHLELECGTPRRPLTPRCGCGPRRSSGNALPASSISCFTGSHPGFSTWRTPPMHAPFGSPSSNWARTRATGSNPSLDAWVLELQDFERIPCPRPLPRSWLEMLDFASASEAWRRGVAGYGAHGNWAALLGLDWISIPLCELRHRPVVERLRAPFKKWLDDWFGDYDAPQRWARFLQTSGGAGLVGRRAADRTPFASPPLMRVQRVAEPPSARRRQPERASPGCCAGASCCTRSASPR